MRSPGEAGAADGSGERVEIGPPGADEQIDIIDDWRSYEPLEMHPILAAAVAGLQEQGFHGTTVRDIARRVGMTMPTLYYHYGSKEGILSAILIAAMDDLTAHLRGGIAEAQGDIDVELTNIVTAVAMHVTKRRHLAGLHPEYRFLGDEARHRYVEMRTEVSNALVETVERGMAAGKYPMGDAHRVSRAVLAMVQGIVEWYREGGEETPEEVARDYVEFAHRLVRGSAPQWLASTEKDLR